MLLLWPVRSLDSPLSSSPKRQGSPVAVEVLESVFPEQTPPPRMQIKATLCHNPVLLPLLALVDSGAEDSFLDRDRALQYGIPFEQLEKPLTATALDGRVIALVTHRSAPVSLVPLYVFLLRWHGRLSPK